MVNKRVGRPSGYSKPVASAICWEIIEGRPLTAICKQEGWPDLKTVYRWIDRYPEFAQDYARARAIQAHVLADQTLAIADAAEGGDSDAAAIARVRMDARRWYSGKILPKVYGTKVLHSDHTGDGPPVVKLQYDYTLLSVDELLTLKRLLQKATPRTNDVKQIEGGAYEDEEEGCC